MPRQNKLRLSPQLVIKAYAEVAKEFADATRRTLPTLTETKKPPPIRK